MTAHIAAVEINEDGYFAFDAGAFALLSGYTLEAVEEWSRTNSTPREATLAVRRRGSEAAALVGRDMDPLETVVHFAVAEGATLTVCGVEVVRDGVPVGGAS